MNAVRDVRLPARRVRRAGHGDLDALVALCAEHAAYERADYDPAGKRGALALALFGPAPRLHAWIAERDGQVVGYATCTLDYSTWAACSYAHMDCLYVCADQRGGGVGAELLAVVRAFAAALGCAELQWQTPDWNEAAARFYRREGAIERPKRRFFLRTGVGP